MHSLREARADVRISNSFHASNHSDTNPQKISWKWFTYGVPLDVWSIARMQFHVSLLNFRNSATRNPIDCPLRRRERSATTKRKLWQSQLYSFALRNSRRTKRRLAAYGLPTIRNAIRFSDLIVLSIGSNCKKRLKPTWISHDCRVPLNFCKCDLSSETDFYLVFI